VVYLLLDLQEQAFLAPRGLLALRALRVLRGPLVPRVLRDLRDLRVLRDLRALMRLVPKLLESSSRYLNLVIIQQVLRQVCI
jgi:hypothetical protein